MTYAEISQRLDNIQPGEKVEYHRGFLAAEGMHTEIGMIGAAAKRASDDGRAILVQRRLTGEINVDGTIFDRFAYIAIGRKDRHVP